jgi:hypothetical protein
MEWMPVRRGPGTMGVVNITSITQVIEWGKLASVVIFDTRVSYRSKEPTLDSCTFMLPCDAVTYKTATHICFILQSLAFLLRLPTQT